MTYDYKSVWEENPLQALSIPTAEIIVLPELSGRSEYRRDAAKIKEMTASIQSEGQLQPALVGVNQDEKYGPVGAPILQVGFGRYEACVAGELPLLCMYTAAPIEEALARGVHENTKREDLSPMQMAATIERLRGTGLKDQEIAKKLGVKPATISTYARFLAKTEDGRDLFSKYARGVIHSRLIPMRGAHHFIDLTTPEEIDDAIRALVEEAKAVPGGKVSSSAVIDKVRTAAKKKPQGKKAKAGKRAKGTKTRSMKQVMDWLTTWDVAGVPKSVRMTVQQVKAYANGEAEAEEVEKVLMKLAT